MQKTTYIIILIFFTMGGYAQVIDINDAGDPQSSFGPEQLIDEVLINSVCSSVRDFTFQVYGTPTETEKKSYGYFKRGAALDFPFVEGIVIASGKVFEGGNRDNDATLGNFNAGIDNVGLPGDTDLNTALNEGGSGDATYIKFTFTPISDTISFRYLMASEEYNGTDECSFTDGFAFLLREVGTTNYQNLAVLDDGSPVTVTNINDSDGCRSNEELFAGYNSSPNGGTIDDTNYNGRTVVLTAFANVTPNVDYEIKLVVADYGDVKFDTAVFLEAGSFNIGLDLGDDITVAGGSSPCIGDTLTLDTLIDTSLGTHTWYKDGAVITGQTEATLDVLESGEYTVEIDFSGTCTATDSITIEFTPIPVLNPIDDQFICDDDNDGLWSLDLATLATQILGAQDPTDVTVSFHDSQTAADTNNSPISAPYTNTTAYTQEEIFIRVQNNINETCYVTGSFLFNVFNQAMANPQVVSVCDNDDDGDATNGLIDFDLTTLTPLVLDGQDASQFYVSYHLNQSDADTPSGELPLLYTSPSQQLIVRVENIDNTDCYDTAIIDLEVRETPIVVPLVDLFQCDDDTDGITEFNLTEANELISVNYVTETFTYHLTEADAEAGSAAIGNPTTYLNTDSSAAPDVLFARTETANGCFGTTQVNLYVSTTDIPSSFQLNFEVCDDDLIDGDNRNGIANFDFSAAEALITAELAVGEALTISYYQNMNDALSEANAITDISNYRNETSPNNQSIIVRVDSDLNNACYGLGEHIILTVNSLPEENNVSDIEFCSDTVDVATIDLTQFDAEVIGSQNPLDFNISYHELASDATSGANALADSYNNSNNPQVIHVRVEDKDTSCFVASINFEITVNANPLINTPPPLELCDDNNSGDGREFFTLEDASMDILGGLTGVTLTFHESLVDARSGVDIVTSPYQNSTINSQTIYARVEDDNTACFSTTSVELIVNSLPNSKTDPQTLILCDIVGVTQTFDLTENQDYIINSEVGVSVTYHETLIDAQGGVSAIPTPTNYTNTTSPQTIFVRVTNDVTGCYVVVNFDVIINPIPNMIAITNLIECEDNTDGIFDFDLELKTSDILNGQDPGIFSVSYYISQDDADNSVNALSSPFTNTVNPQEIFIKTTNTVTNCEVATESFFIEVQESSNANQNVTPFIICDNIGDNDGLGQFDLLLKNTEILQGQDPSIYEVTYYAEFSDADLFINPIPNVYENITENQVIYARVDNVNTSSDFCYEITEVLLEVKRLPQFDLDDDYVLCINSNGTEVVTPPLLDTQLSESDYTFAWYIEGTLIPGVVTSSYLVTEGGNYEVLVTNIASGCQTIDATVVIESGPPSVTVTMITEAFVDNNIIEATVTGNGVYEFSLDNGPWQESGVFENVSGGEHTVQARDLIGCGIGAATILVLDFPGFFTPNGDGYNDTWNIPGLGAQANAKIYIFDRYGKLLKQLNPLDEGWNGTFNGIPLPSSDYWFTIEYQEPSTDELKRFSANFTLKR